MEKNKQESESVKHYTAVFIIVTLGLLTLAFPSLMSYFLTLGVGLAIGLILGISLGKL